MGKLADSAFPGIVDVVEQEEERFLIMEWIEGETLAAQMERDGAFAEETVIEIGICLAKAIQKLHQMQPPLLYLDCKPSNVMKDSDGKIRLIDFGSALEAHTPVTKGISASPGYAAPEQLSREIEKRCVDVRTDVFGLGRTLYALLCGADLSRPPYAFASLKSRCPQVGDELEQIIMRATAREPEARFQTMEAFLQVLLALQEACTVDDTGKKAPFWQKVRRKKTAGGGPDAAGGDRSCEGGRRRSCSRKNSDHPAGWQSAKAPDKRKCRAVYRKAGVFGIKPKHL